MKKGEILATISAPDLDQQLEEAEAQLVQLQAAVQQAQANADLGKVTDARTLAARHARLVQQGTGRYGSPDRGVTHGGAVGRQGECRGPAGRSEPAARS